MCVSCMTYRKFLKWKFWKWCDLILKMLNYQGSKILKKILWIKKAIEKFLFNGKWWAFDSCLSQHNNAVVYTGYRPFSKWRCTSETLLTFSIFQLFIKYVTEYCEQLFTFCPKMRPIMQRMHANFGWLYAISCWLEKLIYSTPRCRGQ